jgi:hypothetical protein
LETVYGGLTKIIYKKFKIFTLRYMDIEFLLGYFMRFIILFFWSSFVAGCTCGSLYSQDYNLGDVKESDNDSRVVVETSDTSSSSTSPEEPDDSPVDTQVENPSPTNMGGGMIQIASTWTPCVDCFVGVPEIDSFASAVFHSSTLNTWYDWIPAPGTCSIPSGPNVNPTEYYDVGTFIQAISPSVTNRLNRFYESGRPTYRSGQLGVYGYTSGVDYSLSVSPNSTLGDFEISTVVTTPREFTHVQPSQYFMSDPYMGFSGVLRRSLTNQFTYAPHGDADFFIVTVDVYDYTGATYLGGVMCVDLDDGGLTMPAGVLSSFPGYSLAAITYYKWIITESIVPTTGDTVEGVGQYGLVGTATLQ